MKKIAVLGLALVLVVAIAMPAAALENVFGGYWRVRAFTQQDFSGIDDYDVVNTTSSNSGDADREGFADTERGDLTRTDTRSRLYYTAKLNDNLKLVTKFEMDAVFGEDPANGGYGDIGSDGVKLEVKNSYADFNLGPVNAKVGVHGGSYGRGFLFADDFAGATVAFNSDAVNVAFRWIKFFEGGKGESQNKFDWDGYAVSPKFKAGGLTINPYFLFMTADNGTNYSRNNGAEGNVDIYYLGLDLDGDFDPVSFWFTGIYQFGEVGNLDVNALLLAGGGSVGVGPADIHGQVFFASGDDDSNDGDVEDFVGPPGQSYYWSEIMGLGTFDAQASLGSPADRISNIIAYNIGASFKPMDKLKLTLDLWYAELVEDDYTGNTELGTEVDFKATYELVEGLNLDIIGAYLFAGDTTNRVADYWNRFGANLDDADPYEVGTRLSLSF